MGNNASGSEQSLTLSMSAIGLSRKRSAKQLTSALRYEAGRNSNLVRLSGSDLMSDEPLDVPNFRNRSGGSNQAGTPTGLPPWSRLLRRRGRWRSSPTGPPSASSGELHR